MKIYLIIILFVALNLCATSYSQYQEKLSLIKVNYRTSEDLKIITDKYPDVQAVDDKSITTYINYQDLLDDKGAYNPSKALAKFGETEIIQKNIQDIVLNTRSRKSAGYHTYKQIVEEFNKAAQTYPTLAKVLVIGTTPLKNEIIVLKISDNVTAEENEPKAVLTGTHHGNEINSTEVIVAMAEEFLQKYSTDAKIKTFVDSREIYLVPSVNVDGFIRGTRYDINGVDPNRDYPGPLLPEHQSIPCITALRNLVEKIKPAVVVDYHAYGKLHMFPWAYKTEPSDHQALFSLVTSNMSKLNNYRFGSISTIIYPAKNSSADFWYWKYKLMALGVEIGTSFNSPREKAIEETLPAVYYLLSDGIESFINN